MTTRSQPLLFQDSADELPADIQPRVAVGDIWRLGRHYLMCGDSTAAADVEGLLYAAPPARLLITDPPYGVGYDAGDTLFARIWAARGDSEAAIAKRRQGAVVNDNRADWGAAFALCPAPIAYIWHGALGVREVMDGAAAAGYSVRQQIVWAKNLFVPGRSHYNGQHENCLYAVRESALGKGGVRWQGGNAESTLWDIPQMSSQRAPIHDRYGSQHPTQKPVECFARPMRNHEADVVMDLFVGSGTIYIAAEREGRTAIGLEISPYYADMAIARYEAYTGDTAALIERVADAQHTD